MGLDFGCILSFDVRQLNLPHTMTWNRRKRFCTVLFALVNLLFMQLAVAGYSCPGGLTKTIKVAETSTVAQTAMPCVGSMDLTMDDEQPSLCHAYDKADSQSAVTYQLPGLASLADLASDFPLPRVTVTVTSLGVPLQAPLLARTTVQSVAVRHCCFRL